MKQFLLSGPPDRDGLVRISGEDFHYLAHVRRLKTGDRFNARLPGSGDPSVPGALVTLELRSLGRGVLNAVVTGGKGDPVPGLPPIFLFQALPKGSKMDLIVRQAAEGALTGVVPFTAERSIARGGNPGDEGEKSRRWGRIIREALQQSGSSTPTSLHSLLDEDGLFAYWEELRAAYPSALGILLHQGAVESKESGGGEGVEGIEGTEGIKGAEEIGGAEVSPLFPLVKASLHRYLSIAPGVVVLAVGPEGGFSPAEVLRFMAAGFRPFTIGNTVLRTETAALYGAAAVRVILLERGSWIQKPR
ncbi:MAG: RsmE family RNA methyltransferase [Treponema sp.]|jgi:16S rRNA (uracil1498-N3)-methyltransferase|nr:RsmE family RNA methyltransferase [Treponema sp.]